MKRIALTLLILGSIGLTAASRAQTSATTFRKDASQYCFSNLTPEEQNHYYSRIVNFGASFTHGCIACDADPALRHYDNLTDDDVWIRRQYLVQFFSHAPWKNPDQSKFEYIYVLENDGSRPKSLIPDWQVRTEGYDGQWIYDPWKDHASLLDPSTSAYIRSNPDFVDDTALVGGIERRFDMKSRRGLWGGMLYQTVPGKYASTGSKPKTVIDLSIDGGRMEDLFRHYIDPALYTQLVQNSWQNDRLRAQAIDQAISHFQAARPNLVIAVDILFWDAIAHSISLLRDSRPTSIVVKFLMALAAASPEGQNYFNDLKRRSVTEDFYKVLAGLSAGANGQPPVPILLGKLMDDPVVHFQKTEYQPIIGALLGQLIHAATGKNLAVEFAKWIRKVSYAQNENVRVTEVEPGWLGQQGKQNEAEARVPRTSGYFDELTGTEFSADEVAALRQAYERYEGELMNTFKQQGVSEDMIVSAQQKAERWALDPSGGGNVGTYLPGYITGIANIALLNLMGDIPGFFRMFNTAFNISSQTSREVTRREDNNVHLVNIDDFFKNFAAFLKPETMHPSVYGAKLMASMMELSVCKSKGPQ